MPADFSSSTTSARSTRRTSGASKASRRLCSLSLHSRNARPGPVRPARPARCSAEAREILRISRVSMPRRGSKLASRARPASITVRTPSMVSEVSATLVETMIFGRLPGETAASWAAGGRPPWSGKMSWLRVKDEFSSVSTVLRISCMPGRKHSTSPGSGRASASLHTAAIFSQTGVSTGGPPRRSLILGRSAR